MKTLNIIIIAFAASFFATQSVADIRFTFKHNPSPVNANLPSSMLPTMYISAKKENGAHLVESESSRNGRNEMYPGESSEESARSVFLIAPDPAGTYNVNINCYLRANSSKSGQFFTKKLPDLKDGSTVNIEAECPITNVNDVYNVAPPKNIIIKVDGNYIMGAPVQGEAHK